MEVLHRLRRGLTALLCILMVAREGVCAERQFYVYRPEARNILVRDPDQLPRARIPVSTPPRTVSRPRPETEPWQLSLDEAIRIALANSEVVRILAGTSAVVTGSTIYDPAITNTTIDQEQAIFDPVLTVDNAFNQFERPVASFVPGDPTASFIDGTTTETYDLNFGLSKRILTGGEFGFDVPVTNSRFSPGVFPLNPQTTSGPAVSFRQPLLQGGGIAANLAPIVIARIETERSFFQFKASVQDLVRSVIDAYWSLVFARTDVWARQQQVEQSQFALNRAEARLQEGFADLAEVTQTRVALATFRANLIAAQANLLNTEAGLRNLLGLPPNDQRVIIPTTPPATERVEFNWEALVELAERHRPDIIELKLVLEADQQQLLLARNQAQPRLDAVALYRWNGLEGRMPDGTMIGTDGSEFTDWTLGVNFSVPLGLRQGRAAVRQRELLIMRDRAQLEQAIHAATHELAATLRLHDSRYEQYLAYRTMREAAQTNLEQQFAEYGSGRAIFLNVLEAIADWGNAITSEAQSLTDYSTARANLERDTGTILETHGIRFFEERYGSISPLGLPQHLTSYPKAEVPSSNTPLYPDSDKAAEEFFDLRSPVERPLDGVLPEPAEPVRPLLDGARAQPATNDSSLQRWPASPLRLPEVSFVTQRFDRVEPAGTAGGIEAEKDSHQR